MRVRITAPPTLDNVDGVPLEHFQVGRVYALSASLATLMIVEGWAEPVVEDVPPTLPAFSFDLMAPPERSHHAFARGRPRRHRGIAADRRRRH